MHYNFIAWMPLFVAGILTSKVKNDETLESNINVYSVLTMIVSIVAIFIINYNFYSWTLMPFVSVLFFYTLGRLLYSIKSIRKVGVWIGSISSYIFVAHPIAQMLSEKILSVCQVRALPMRLLYIVIMYVCITLLLTYLYKPIHKWLIKKVECKY